MATYTHTCAICGKDFTSTRKTSKTCSRVCQAKNAGRAPSKLICACGKPASKRGYCSECSLERKREARRRDYYKRREQILAQRRQRWLEDEELRQYHKGVNERRRFNALRDARLELDGHACTRCSTTDALVVHHVNGHDRSQADEVSTLDDLLTLCRACHMDVHREQGDLG